MDANRTRQLLNALSGLLAADPEQADGLAALLPPEYAGHYQTKQTSFDNDPVDLFCACLEDYYWDWEEQIAREYPAAADILDGLPDILAMSEPHLYSGEPEQWTDFRRQLADLIGRLEKVV